MAKITKRIKFLKTPTGKYRMGYHAGDIVNLTADSEIITEMISSKWAEKAPAEKAPAKTLSAKK